MKEIKIFLTQPITNRSSTYANVNVSENKQVWTKVC